MPGSKQIRKSTMTKANIFRLVAFVIEPSHPRPKRHEWHGWRQYPRSGLHQSEAGQLDDRPQ
jgi:hypothetical protein